MKTAKKESVSERKLRLAQELVKRGKEAEQAAWRAKWEAQSKDPVYQAKQAERAAKSDERQRTRLINAENRALKAIADMEVSFGGRGELEYTAYHEAGHAVLHEVLGLGVAHATIIPKKLEQPAPNSNEVVESDSLGHVQSVGSLPIRKRQRVIADITCFLAGGFSSEMAGDEEWQWGIGGDMRLIEKSLSSLGYKSNSAEAVVVVNEATALCYDMLEQPKIWQAIEDVKELLLTEKTISGADVRAVVRMQDFPIVGIPISKQLNFHYRKNRPTALGWGVDPKDAAPSYQLGVGVTTGTASYYGAQGYTLTEPMYFKELTKGEASVRPSRNITPKALRFASAAQLRFPFTQIALREVAA